MTVAGSEKFLFAVPQKSDRNFRAAQRTAQRRLNAGGGLAPVGLQEFETGGRIEKQIPHTDDCPGRAAGDFHLVDISCGQGHAGAFHVLGTPGGQFDMGYRGDCGQSFAAKAHGLDGFKPVLVMQFGSGVPQKSDPGIFGRHAAAVVRDADHRGAAVADFHRDMLCPGVKGVFNQFLDHRSGAFDNLAGGDQIRNMRRQKIDLRHERFLPEGSSVNSHYTGFLLKLPYPL